MQPAKAQMTCGFCWLLFTCTHFKPPKLILMTYFDALINYEIKQLCIVQRQLIQLLSPILNKSDDPALKTQISDHVTFLENQLDDFMVEAERIHSL